MKTNEIYDVIIVGGGIVGLSMALANAKRGKKVAVFERHPQAAGASVRNFGMVWPIGQPAGNLFDRAMRSREIWLDLSRETGMWARPTGSLHLAYHDDEMAVLEEFAATTKGAGYQCQLVTPAHVRSLSPIARMEGLRGALWSETEVNIYSRMAIKMVSDYIQKKYAVDFFLIRLLRTLIFQMPILLIRNIKPTSIFMYVQVLILKPYTPQYLSNQALQNANCRCFLLFRKAMILVWALCFVGV